MLRYLLQRLSEPSIVPPPLHRWCHAKSIRYQDAGCRWEAKMDQATWDNHFSGPGGQPTKGQQERQVRHLEERTPLNDALVNGFGI